MSSFADLEKTIFFNEIKPLEIIEENFYHFETIDMSREFQSNVNEMMDGFWTISIGKCLGIWENSGGRRLAGKNYFLKDILKNISRKYFLEKVEEISK